MRETIENARNDISDFMRKITGSIYTKAFVDLMQKEIKNQLNDKE